MRGRRPYSVSRPAASRAFQTSVPRLAVSRPEAAEALGMSLAHFDRVVRPSVAVVYSGKLRLYPIAELQRWLDAEAVPPGRRAA